MCHLICRSIGRYTWLRSHLTALKSSNFASIRSCPLVLRPDPQYVRTLRDSSSLKYEDTIDRYKPPKKKNGQLHLPVFSRFFSIQKKASLPSVVHADLSQSILRVSYEILMTLNRHGVNKHTPISQSYTTSESIATL